jgi:DNA-binding transcriptional MerR regulator
MRIGELARASGMTPDRVRFYEREGLLPSAHRTAANYRDFSPDALTRLEFVREARRLGFTVREVAELLALRAAGPADCETLRARAQKKLSDLDDQIRRLQAARRALRDLIHGCTDSRPAAECATVRTVIEA